MYQYKRKIPKKLITDEAEHYLQENNIHEFLACFEQYSISYYQLFEDFFDKTSVDGFNNVYMSFLVPEKSTLDLEIKDSQLVNFVSKSISLNTFSSLDKKISFEEKKLARKQGQSKSYHKQLTHLNNLKNSKKRKKKNYYETLGQIIGYSTNEINLVVDNDYSEFLFFLRKFNKRITVKPQ